MLDSQNSSKCLTCGKERELDPEWKICQKCSDDYNNRLRDYERVTIPRCSLCRKPFIKNGNQWKGNCTHFKGKAIEW
jgi:NMD protein affecting ribosome stability and mRNA decay